MSKAKQALIDPLFDNNPIALQVLGICSALAVTTKMETSLVMCVALTAVLCCSNVAVSLLRDKIPSSIINKFPPGEKIPCFIARI